MMMRWDSSNPRMGRPWRDSATSYCGHDWKEDETRLTGLLSSGYGGRIGVIGSRSKWQAFEAAALEHQDRSCQHNE